MCLTLVSIHGQLRKSRSRVAQSVARLTHEPEVPGSIPGKPIQEGQLSVSSILMGVLRYKIYINPV